MDNNNRKTIIKAMLRVLNLSKHYGGQILFEDASFVVGLGEKIGLVGRNGAGKSTLFKIIRGLEGKDGGEISFPKNYTIGALEQHLKFSESTVIAEVMTGFVAEKHRQEEVYLENEKYRAEKILMGLGFKKSDFERSPSEFSGGYQVRIQLAKTLLGNPSLLLLDEPTNYLDIVSIYWLKKFLKTYPGEVILITHDRFFMDEVVTHVMGIHRKKIKKFPGNTGHFYERILEEEEIYEKTRLNIEAKKKELESFIERFKAKASKAGQARSRMKQLEKLDDLDALQQEDNASFQFNFKECPAKVLCQVKGLSFRYTPDDSDLFNQLTFPIEAKDRIGIIGKNGRGKSTLLNVIAGNLTPTTGQFKFHPSCLLGFYGQTNIKRLNEKNTIIQEIAEAGPNLIDQQVRNICGTMLFSGDQAKKYISVLSGGEKARVLFGKVMANPSNLLLLDEPTNHLDMQSIEALSDEIDSYPGALVVVTHNEHLLHAFAKKLIIFKNGNAEFFLGTYQDFLDRGGWDKVEQEEEAFETAQNSGKNVKKSNEKSIENPSNEGRIPPSRNENAIIEKEIATLEQKIIEHEEILKKIETSLLEAYTQNNSVKIQEFAPLAAKIKEKLENLYFEFEEKVSMLSH